jgi:hypothetical protein
LVERQDRLLSDEAEYVLTEWLKITPNWGTEQYLKFVRRARAENVDSAVRAFHRAEDVRACVQAWVGTPGLDAKRQFVHQHADLLLTDEAEELLPYLAQEQPDQRELLETQEIILRGCRSDGIDATYRLVAPEYSQHLFSLFVAWAALPDRERSMRYLEDHGAELLSEWARSNLKRAVQSTPDLAPVVELLDACAQIGIEQAYQALGQDS